jgi:plasmid stabilization system protein ParE
VEIVWSRSADRDVAQVYAYLESQSYRAARRFIRRLFEALDTLAEMPRMGKVSPIETEKEYRELVVEHHKIFYYIDENRLIIGRLWDTRQDPTKFFLPKAH